MGDDFLTIRQADIAWQNDEGETDVLALGRGAQVKVLYRGEYNGEKQTDLLLKFPPGYEEPGHTHDGEHSVVILEGRMIVDGRELGPGDYVLGPSHVPHGPYYYPDGLTAFVSFRGSPLHLYEGSPAGTGKTPD